MKNGKKLLKQIATELQRQNRKSLIMYDNNMRYFQNSENNDACTEKTPVMDEDFLERKNTEAIQYNQAFLHLVQRVTFLENQQSQQDEEIVELQDKMDKMQEKADRMKDSVSNLKTKVNGLEHKVVKQKNKIQELFDIIRSIGYFAGIDCNIKNKDLKATWGKWVRKERRRKEKECMLVDRTCLFNGKGNNSEY